MTGLYSHFAQHPPSWFLLPSRPAGLYRVTQGLHIATGLASIPLLLAKLWTVYPKLFTWPPFSSIANALERLAIFPLVAGSLFLLFTGLANINLWYPWKFNFPDRALLGRVDNDRRAHRPHRRQMVDHPTTSSARDTRPDQPTIAGDAATVPRRSTTLERRRFLATVFGTSAVVTLFTVGQTVRPLRKLALLAPRRPDTGTQGFPVNRTARSRRRHRHRTLTRLSAHRHRQGPSTAHTDTRRTPRAPPTHRDAPDRVRRRVEHLATSGPAYRYAISSRWPEPDPTRPFT